jgi:hypothetical protein
VAVDVPSRDPIDVEDLTDEEEEPCASSSLDEGNPGQPPIHPLPMNLGIVDNEIWEEIENLEGQWDHYYEEVRTVTNLLRSKASSFSKVPPSSPGRRKF